MNIHTFTLKGKDIEVTYNNGFLAYTFMFNDQPYGQKMKPESKKVLDIASCTYLLLINALETMEQLEKDDNS